MPMTADFARMAKLERNLRQLGTPGSPTERAFLGKVREKFKPAVLAMYDSGVGPDGRWQAKKGGGQPFTSRKMAGMVAISRLPGGLLLAWRRAWMLAQDEGHTFQAREARGGVLYTDANTRRILSRRSRRGLLRSMEQGKTTVVQTARGPLVVRNYKGKTTMLGVQRSFGAHRIGQRVLPARHQLPRSGMPPAWRAALQAGADAGFAAFAERAL